jgi:hypothetical protein
VKNPVKCQKIAVRAAVLAGLSILQACGGGGTSDDLSNLSSSDNPGGVATYAGVQTSYLGTISGLGSIVVNGVRFETTSATVMDSDELYGSAEYTSPLALGMTVALQGSADEAQSLGSASKIRLMGGVRGTVSAYVSGQAMTVGGQTVTLNANTLYADATGQSFTPQAGSYVNVYGVMQADNSFLATRVVSVSATNFRLDAAWRGQSSALVTAPSGLTLSLSTGSSSFSISCPVVSCAVEPAGADLTGVHAVRVLAVDDSQRSGSNVIATKIQVLDATQVLNWAGGASGQTKIKGVATLVGTQWAIGGVPVLSNETPWTLGQFYEVRGVLSNGVLTATRWELEGQESYRSITAGGSTSHYSNELFGAVSNLQGNTMTVQGTTVDVSQAYFERGSLATLSNGVYVEIKGVMNGGVLMASKVDSKLSTVAGQGTRFEVYGVVSNWSNSGFSLASGNTVYNAVLSSQTRIDQEHGLPANGRFVEVKGYMSGTDFVVLKMEVKSAGDHHAY